jgi:hypothetical protein
MGSGSGGNLILRVGLILLYISKRVFSLSALSPQVSALGFQFSVQVLKMSSIKCPLVGRMTVESHYQSMVNALEAGFRLAQKASGEGEALTDDLLAELMEKENLWMHDPRSKDGFKGGGSRERASSSGSGSNGDPGSKARGGYQQELSDIPYDSSRCCRRHWNGGLVSSDGLQAGAQCLNSLDGENVFCSKCEDRYQKAQVTDGDGNRGLDWHGSFSKPVREDPGWKKDGKVTASGYPHWSKLSRDDEDPEEASAKEALKAEKAAQKAQKAAEKEAKKAQKEVEKAEKEAEKETKKAEKEAQKVEKKPKKIKKFKKIKKEQVAALSQDSEDEMADMVEAEELKAEEPKAEEPKAEEPKAKAEEPKAKAEELEAKAEELDVDPTDIIDLDGTQYIHDKESDTIYTKSGEPVGNWVDGQPVWDNWADDTEELSAEESDEESDESDSEE